MKKRKRKVNLSQRGRTRHIVYCDGVSPMLRTPKIKKIKKLKKKKTYKKHFYFYFYCFSLLK
jgi:hypothetical protein